MFHMLSQKVISEIEEVLEQIDEQEVKELIEAILKARKVVLCGAGRMGMMARAFAMRLSHLGLQAYDINDCNTPRLSEGDLLVVCSGSGETKTILALVGAAYEHKAKIALITANGRSSMSLLSDIQIYFPSPSRVVNPNMVKTIQPMKTLSEQFCLLFFDTIVLILMDNLNRSHETMSMMHSILE